MPLLSCKNLTLGYEGRAIISRLDFTVNPGDYLAIVGENGSGKSTLMKAMLGLVTPMSGKIEFGAGLLPGEMGYLPQQTIIQRDFPASVREIVRSGCLGRAGMRPFLSRAEKVLAEQNMARMGIDRLGSSCYRDLSGGQQQRVLLARALCATRKMLLLDEPVSGLDPKATAELYSVINSLNKEDGITVVMISHDVSVALRYADFILHIGSPMFFGAKDEYKKSEAWRNFATRGEEDLT